MARNAHLVGEHSHALVVSPQQQSHNQKQHRKHKQRAATQHTCHSAFSNACTKRPTRDQHAPASSSGVNWKGGGGGGVAQTPVAQLIGIASGISFSGAMRAMRIIIDVGNEIVRAKVQLPVDGSQEIVDEVCIRSISDSTAVAQSIPIASLRAHRQLVSWKNDG
jgi:hypothetical protein